MPDLAGQTLGKYQLIDRLGRGGMADVYKGYQPGLDRYVAIKVLHQHLAEDPDFITRFRREAKSVAELRHPHIVQVFDFDVQGDNYYMVMEYIEGGKTLKQLLQDLSARGERLPLDVTLDLMTKVADALAYAHGVGMFHRDIKPANVLLSSLNRPVLSDFGIARIVGQTGLTGSGIMVGTPAYMSPEQGKGERGDARSDIYSLGIVLYEMLTGRPPYDADTPYAIILKHINDPLVPPHSLIGPLSDPVERIVLRSLAKNPDDRFASMVELRDALRAAHQAISAEPERETVSVSTPPTVEVKPVPTPAPSAVAPSETGYSQGTGYSQAAITPSIPRRAWPIAAVAGVIALLAMAVFALSRPGPPAPSPTPTQAAVAAGTPAPPPEPREAQAQVEVGYELLFGGDVEAALSRFNRALETQSDYPPALVGRAMAELTRYGDFDRAARDLSAAAPTMQGDPFFSYALGLQHTRSESRYDPQAAERDFTQAIEKCGNHTALCAAAYRDRAELYAWTLNSLGAALSDMDNAIRLDPFEADRPWLLATRADMHAASGNAAGALQDFEAAYDRSQSGEFLERAAALAVHIEDYPRALDYYRRLLEAQPGSPHYLVMQGYVQWRSGDNPLALETAQRALDLPPQPLEAHYLMGLLLLDGGQPQEALAELQQFAAVADDDVLYQASFPFFQRDFGHEIHYDMARAAHAAGDLDAALGFVNESFRRDDSWPEAIIERGRIYAERGDPDRAREEFRKAREAASGRPELQAAIDELLIGVARGVIKIATASSRAGDLASWGEGLGRAVELAIAELGEPLREMGFVVQVVPFDDRGSPDGGVESARQAIADPDVLCVVGHLLSNVTEAASEQYHAAHLAMISPSATDPRVTQRGYLEINRVVGRGDVQGVVGMGYAKSIGIQSMYIVHEQSVSGQALVDVMQPAARQLQIALAGITGTDERENFGAVIQPILAARPDAVYFAGFYNPAGVFFRQLREQGYAGVLMGADGLDNPGLVQLGGQALLAGKGTIYSAVAGPPTFYPDAARFVEAYTATYGHMPPPYAAQAYDAAGICLDAIKVAVEDGGGELPTREQVATNVRGVMDYPGITGTLTFNAKGDLKTAKYFMIRLVSADPQKWNENKIEYTLDFSLPDQ